MKIFLINEEEKAKQIRQLKKLKSECIKLYWSQTITDLPEVVRSALDTIKVFVDQKIGEVCKEDVPVGTLSDEDEDAVVALLRKYPELGAILGSCVILAGEEAEKTAEFLDGKAVPKVLLDAISSGKNVVLF